MELDTNGLKLGDKAAASIAGQRITIVVTGIAQFDDRPEPSVLCEWMDAHSVAHSQWVPVSKVHR